MNKLAVGLVLIFVSLTIATICPTVNDVCSDVGGQCSTQQSCTNCSAAQTACLGVNSTCYCYSEYVDCLSAAKNPNCPASVVYDICMSSLTNCTCGTPYTGSVTEYNCRSNAYCNETSATCVALKTQGQSCTYDYECASNDMYAYPFQCVSQVCKQQLSLYANPNDGCKVNGDCLFSSSEGLGCSSGLCASHPVASACTNQGSCGAAAFCNTTVNTCQANYAAGATCKTTTDLNMYIVCGQNMLCGGSSKCVAYYSQDLNAACNVSDECKGDYVCLDNKCSNPLPVLACSTATDCTNASSNYKGCSCGYCGRETKSLTSCDDTAVAAWNCAQQNGCVAINGEYNFIPNSCIQNHCNNEFLCYYACRFADSSVANVVCPSGDVSCPTPASAAVTAVSVVLSAVAVFALMF